MVPLMGSRSPSLNGMAERAGRIAHKMKIGTIGDKI